jgi:rhodanese-related sulfurtransferase
LISLIDGEYRDTIDSFIIVDCRYSFEYAGGHIDGAENVSCPKILEERFFSNPTKTPKSVVIFHCEYSLQRAPRMYLIFNDKQGTSL